MNEIQSHSKATVTHKQKSIFMKNSGGANNDDGGFTGYTELSATRYDMRSRVSSTLVRSQKEERQGTVFGLNEINLRQKFVCQ